MQSPSYLFNENQLLFWRNGNSQCETPRHISYCDYPCTAHNV